MHSSRTHINTLEDVNSELGFPIGNFRQKLTRTAFFEENRENLKKFEKRKFIKKMNILAKFHQEKLIFDEVRGHLLILLFDRALTRASDGLLWKKAIKF